MACERGLRSSCLSVAAFPRLWGFDARAGPKNYFGYTSCPSVIFHIVVYAVLGRFSMSHYCTQVTYLLEVCILRYFTGLRSLVSLSLSRPRARPCLFYETTEMIIVFIFFITYNYFMFIFFLISALYKNVC